MNCLGTWHWKKKTRIRLAAGLALCLTMTFWEPGLIVNAQESVETVNLMAEYHESGLILTEVLASTEDESEIEAKEVTEIDPPVMEQLTPETTEIVEAEPNLTAKLSTEGQIWTGWQHFESGYGKSSWYQTGGGGGYSYGRYQFDIRLSVANFLGTCIDTGDPVYAEFSQYVFFDGTGYQMLTDEGLAETWVMVCDAKQEDFFQRQTHFAMKQYYQKPARRLLEIYGIDLDEYSAILKGTVWSIAIRDGSSVSLDADKNNLSAVTDTYQFGIDEEEWLERIYDAETMKHSSDNERWQKDQRTEALELFNDLQSGSEIDNLMSL